VAHAVHFEDRGKARHRPWARGKARPSGKPVSGWTWSIGTWRSLTQGDFHTARQRALDGAGIVQTGNRASRTTARWRAPGAQLPPPRQVRRLPRSSRAQPLATAPPRAPTSLIAPPPAPTNHVVNRSCHEAHLPAQQSPPRPQARVPCSYAYARRSHHRQESASQGPEAAQRLISVPTVQGSSAVERLRSSADITAALAARRRAGRLVVVHARTRDDDDATRVAVIASRRVGGAVQRNRAKRLLREASRQTAWQAGHDVVLVARAATARSNMSAVHADMLDVASRLDLLGSA
jgi:ribonuclease P protein component